MPLQKQIISQESKREKSNTKVGSEDPSSDRGASFPIVAIGASAGGLGAFESFFSGMPADRDPGMAFVLVQHLAPDHKSILVELIKRCTPMQVFEVSDGMEVQPNCAYIIPPNRNMAYSNGSLHLLELVAPRGLRLPIDFFFRSLAQDLHERAIGIVLSGAGNDGAAGVRVIKAEGGMVMAQSSESTTFNSMPHNAIATGLVDFVLAPADMPAQLIKYVTHAFGGQAISKMHQSEKKNENILEKVCVLLRAQTGHDFSNYKENTIIRRIERRMAIQQIERVKDYLRYLQQNQDEVEALFRDLLIGVTSFFRDPEAFEALEALAVPRIFKSKPQGALIRVWVPGCSTGEEAYSIAMLLKECSDALGTNAQVQIFATDIDSLAIDTARAGVYSASIAGDISPERLRRFFSLEPDGGAWRINKSIRDMLVFSTQDLIRDPPFSKLDLISCRNLLIYMGGTLQKKLIPLFHYALKPDGFLFLGTSESVGEYADLFDCVDAKSKLYHRKEGLPRSPGPGIDRYFPPNANNETVLGMWRKVPVEPKLPLREITERTLLQQYDPVGALVDKQGDILYLYGRSGLYLEPAQGEPGMNALKMAREGLKGKLALALHQAASQRATVRHPGLRVKTNGEFTLTNLTIQPVPMQSLEGGSGPQLYLILLEKAQTRSLENTGAPSKALSMDPASAPLPGDADSITALRQELEAKDEYLQSTLEEMQTTNEELNSSNEEMQSINEELQSTNEELETSKEELQSVNEELSTVNAELQKKVEELTRINNDMNNLLAGTEIGTIFVDLKLCILRFTPTATQVINLIQTDVGRPLSHIVSNLEDYDSLIEDVNAVLENLVPREVEARTLEGKWFLLRIRPYRTLENVIEGAVLTFTDITENRTMREALMESESANRLAAVLRDVQDAITVQDMEGRILAWNPAAERIFGWSEAEALNMNICEMLPGNQYETTLLKIRECAQATILQPQSIQRLSKSNRIVEILLTATPLIDKSGRVYAIVTIEREGHKRT
ncbi:chemotaxis protein CheB [Desulfatibacillum aliphaticivorans]|uniref:chemotaxis protein CheB n=1 Tax=Desulfatibacillum aliphaticivorans TaxID=218208 RepID=UPI00041DA00C|nr:chemotaxis protein CheB [Desulfatibacillum aliphaticivorans]